MFGFTQYSTASETVAFGMYVVLALSFAAYVVFGFVFRYHWFRYGASEPRARLFSKIYFIGGLVLLSAMSASAILF